MSKNVPIPLAHDGKPLDCTHARVQLGMCVDCKKFIPMDPLEQSEKDANTTARMSTRDENSYRLENDKLKGLIKTMQETHAAEKKELEDKLRKFDNDNFKLRLAVQELQSDSIMNAQRVNAKEDVFLQKLSKSISDLNELSMVIIDDKNKRAKRILEKQDEISKRPKIAIITDSE